MRLPVVASFALLIAGAGGLGLGCASSGTPAVTCAPTGAAGATGTASAPVSATTAPPGDDLTALTSEQLATKLLELTGAATLGKQVLDGMAQNMSKMRGLPPGFMERLQANARPEELGALLVPIYVRNFDRDTLVAAIGFYESSHGRTMVAHLPQATKESMEAGQQWGRALAQKTLADMGLAPPPSSPPSSP
jgi:hypothetical protein